MITRLFPLSRCNNQSRGFYLSLIRPLGAYTFYVEPNNQMLLSDLSQLKLVSLLFAPWTKTFQFPTLAALVLLSLPLLSTVTIFRIHTAIFSFIHVPLCCCSSPFCSRYSLSFQYGDFLLHTCTHFFGCSFHSYSAISTSSNSFQKSSCSRCNFNIVL